MNTFTERELIWIEKIKELGEEMSKETDSKELWLLNSYSNFLETMIRYENLRDPGPFVRKEKLLRSHKAIPSGYLDFLNCKHLLFEGLYFIHKVIFIPKDIAEKIMSTRTFDDFNSLKEQYNLDDDICFNSVKYVKFEDTGNSYGVFLIRSEITKRYMMYNSNWSYPYF